MKYLKILILLILCMPLVLGATESIVKTKINVRIESGNVLHITGEGLEWSKTLNVTTVCTNVSNVTTCTPNALELSNDNLELLMIRSFGNATEVSELMEICENNLNFTQKWKDCVELNLKLDLEKRIIEESMINKSILDECQKNTTDVSYACESSKRDLENAKTTELTTCRSDLDNSQKQKSWTIIAAVVFAGIAIFTYGKYRGFGKKNQFEERNRPRDFQF